MKSVACVGVGNIGRAWAIAFARGGCEVRLYDANGAMLEKSLRLMSDNIDDLAAAGMIDDASAVKARLTHVASMEEALSGAAYVQESVREDLELKREIFQKMDAIAAPETILASSTSEFMSSQFAADLPHAERCMVAHPFNPPYLIPLVELSGHDGVDAGKLEQARALLEEVGMTPVIVRKEIKALLLNRLQAAVVSEALFLVGEGYCSAEDLDKSMTDGLGLRWAFMGPFMTGHLNASGGYRQYMRMFGGTYRRMVDDLKKEYQWSDAQIDAVSDEMERTIALDQVDRGQRWRDRRLMALLKHRRDAEPFA